MDVFINGAVNQEQLSMEIRRSFEDGAPAGWGPRIDTVRLEGTRRWGEAVFYLPDSRTLLCSDLVFNIHDAVNLRTEWLLRLVGAHERVAQSRSIRFFFTRDKSALGDSYARILSWDFDRIVVGHGRIVESDAHAKLTDALEWALSPERRALPA